MFQSYETNHAGMTTIIANYGALEDPYGGPNYFTMDPGGLYEISIDNNGDLVEDFTFQFRFSNKLNDATDGNTGVQLTINGAKESVWSVQANLPATAGGAVPPVTATNEGAVRNVLETYTVGLVTGPRRVAAAAPVTNTAGGANAGTFVKPLDYIGPKTLGNLAAYNAYAKAHVYPVTIPGCATAGQVFVGQRQEGFRVNLGLIFDLVNAPSVAAVTTGSRSAFNSTPFDNTQGKNVTSIALEIPTKCLLKDGLDPATSKTPIIGAWTTSSVRQARIINPGATFTKPTKEGGAWAQVSRLGMPLTNEVIIGLKDKDLWNMSAPAQDAQFDHYLHNATLPAILSDLFGLPFPTVDRADLLAIFHTGVPGINNFALNAGSAATDLHGDELRLNTSFGAYKASGAQTDLGAALCFAHSPTATAAAAAKCDADVGTIADCIAPTVANAGCDVSGFPNGRRPGDDVVDIELTAVTGFFLPKPVAALAGAVLHDAVHNSEGITGGQGDGSTCTKDGDCASGVCNGALKCDPTQFDPGFPYLKAPHSGDPQ